MLTCCTSAQPSSRRRPHRRSVACLLALVLAVAPLLPALGQSGSAATPIQATDLLRLRTIQDVVLSPNGRYAAYTVRRVVRSDPGAPTYTTQLYVAPANGRGAPQLLTRPPHRAAQPAWHPDGGLIAFVRPVDGTPQIFVQSMSGGEPYQLTTARHGATHPQWGPSGDRLLFASEVPEPALHRATNRPPPSERPGRTARDTIRRIPADTLLVLRHAQTLDPVDTLDLTPGGDLRLRADTSRPLRTSVQSPGPDSLAATPVDSLTALSSDSLRAVFEALRLRPDTTTVPVLPDTAATPEGDLLQVRRWLDQRPPAHSQVLTRPNLHGPNGIQPTPHYRHYFVVDVPTTLESGDPPRPSARPVTWGYRSFGGVDWLPGGTQIVVSGTPRTQRPLDRVEARNLYVADLQPRRIRRLLKIEDYRLTDPKVTTNGTTIAFRARAIADAPYARHRIGLFALDGRSEPELITGDFPHDIGPIKWSPGGWYLYTTAPTRGGQPLYRFAPFARSDTTAPRASPSLAPDQSASRDTFALDTTMVRTAQHTRMTQLPRGIHAFDVTDATAVYAATDPDTPSELFTNTVSFGNERRISSLNEWRGRRRLSTPTRLTASSDSFSVDGWLTRPAPSSDSLRYPLAVWPRGGPPGFASGRMTPQAWLARHYLAAQGFAVLEVKPRGTAGYGPSFRRASHRNWGAGPMRDLLAVADSATTRAWIDSTQQVLVGEGYGGYLATWTLTQTDRFRAAVAQSGVYDLPALYGEGKAGRQLPAQFGGYPWEGARRTLPPGADTLLADSLTAPIPDGPTPRSTLHRNSPLSAVDRIQSPLLLLHGGDDHHTGPAQPQRLYKSLKALGRPVEYVRYPGVGHDFATTATPRQRLDRLVRLYEFLERFTESPVR